MENKLKQKNNIEVDIYDAVGIRFENISMEEFHSIAASLTLFISKLNREPDIVVSFVNEIDTPDLIFIGLNYAAFDEGNFYIIYDSFQQKKVIIPFDMIGQKMHIICERGIYSIPLLNHIINLYFIKNGFIPIHSSGFYYDQKGILVMGWTKGGKTETLLSFANHGADYIGDEWVILSQNGLEMFSLHVPVTIWKWQLSQIRKLIDKITLADRSLFAFVEMLNSLNTIALKLKINRLFLFKLLNQNLQHFKKLLKIRKMPEKIFKDKIRYGKTKLNTIVLALSHGSNKITVNECESREIINRMIHSNDYELLPFFEYYRAYKFAFPEKNNEFLDNIKEMHAALLLNALEGKKSFKIIHPYPVSFESLFSKLSSAISLSTN